MAPVVGARFVFGCVFFFFCLCDAFLDPVCAARISAKFTKTKTAPKRNYPGQGRKRPPEETELAQLILDGERCPFLNQRRQDSIEDLNPSGLDPPFIWIKSAVVASMRARIRARNPTHYVFKYPRLWLSQFLKAHPEIHTWTKSQLAKWSGISQQEVYDRCCGSFYDFYQLKQQLLHDGYEKMVLVNVDETSIPLQPPPSSVLGKKNEVPHRLPDSTYKLATLLASASRDPEEFCIPPMFILHSSLMSYAEKQAIIQFYCGLSDEVDLRGVAKSPFYGNDDAWVCPNGSCNGTTHLDSSVWGVFLLSVAKKWKNYRASQGLNCDEKKVALIIQHDGASAHASSEMPQASLAENHIFIHKLRPNITSFINYCDQFSFSSLKHAVSLSWTYGCYNSLLSHDVREKIMSLKFGSPGNFRKMGLDTDSAAPVCYDDLDARLRKLFGKTAFTERMRFEGFGNLEWMEPHQKWDRKLAELIDTKYRFMRDFGEGEDAYFTYTDEPGVVDLEILENQDM